MSRTREGKEPRQDLESQSDAAQTTDQASRSQIDERLGARGQTDYTGGRESRRDFPRRSTSRRERANLYSQQGETYRSQPIQSQGRYSRGSYENRPEMQSRYRATTPYGRRGETQEDFDVRSSQQRLYERSPRHSSYGRTSEYGRESSGRPSRRDFESEGRFDRSSDYDRENRGFRSQREEYDEPYQRETFSGQYGNYGRSYEPGRYDAGQEFDRYEDDYETEGRRDWDDRGHDKRHLRCADIMTKDVTICSPQTVIRDVADKLDEDSVGSLPVVENGRLVGIITDRDIVCRVLAEGRDSRTTFASDAMSEDVITCTPGESVIEAIHKMGEHQIRRIPVCDTNGRLRGIIAMADVALEAENDQEIAQALEQISRPTPDRSRRV